MLINESVQIGELCPFAAKIAPYGQKLVNRVTCQVYESQQECHHVVLHCTDRLGLLVKAARSAIACAAMAFRS